MVTKLKLGQNWTTLIMAKLNTQIETKLKNSNVDKTHNFNIWA